MPIEFHCEHCGKMIRAADEHGGKHGKCPACHQRVYIPSPEIEPLELAPVDELAERRARQAVVESNQLADALLSDAAPSPASATGPERGPNRAATSAGHRAGGAAPRAEPTIDVGSHVNEYAIAMFEGDLEEAQQIADGLRRQPRPVEETIQRILADEIPPAALDHIPRPVLIGFLRQLRAAVGL